MFFGGWLYPDALAIGVAGVEFTFDREEFGCAAVGRDAAQATRAPSKKQFRLFRIGICSLRCKSEIQNRSNRKTAMYDPCGNASQTCNHALR
jgi:hypothetical protein